MQTPTTLVYKEVVEGKGPFPMGDSQVSIHLSVFTLRCVGFHFRVSRL